MEVFFRNEGGHLVRCKKRGELRLCLGAVSLTLNKRTLIQLKTYLNNRDLKEAMFRPEEKCVDISWVKGKISLHLNYFEFLDVRELVEEGIAELKLASLLQGAGVCRPENLSPGCTS
ncbi:MAG: hypothetical protein MRZ79_27625 [Bacteroidia bacterium]|nr:hypothetical protein [Bacteroidia bacterium]